MARHLGGYCTHESVQGSGHTGVHVGCWFEWMCNVPGFPLEINNAICLTCRYNSSARWRRAGHLSITHVRMPQQNTTLLTTAEMRCNAAGTRFVSFGVNRKTHTGLLFGFNFVESASNVVSE